MDVQSYLSRFRKAEKISRGMSGDEKYHVYSGDAEYLLRVSDGEEYNRKKTEYEYLHRLNKYALNIPECIEFTKSNDGSKVFTLLSWIPGEEAEKLLPCLDGDAQYALGLKAGKILRSIHSHSPAVSGGVSWYDSYFKVMQPRLDAFRAEGIPFEGSDRILSFIEDNKHLLHERPVCRHHGDYHTGNMIVRGGELWVIDWHTVDFDNIGDPWYEFNRIGMECPQFAKGQVDGYLDSVPDEFWRLFALYFSASAITSIVWAKYWAPDQLECIMELNRSVLQMFDNMEDPVPRWYRGLE